MLWSHRQYAYIHVKLSMVEGVSLYLRWCIVAMKQSACPHMQPM